MSESRKSEGGCNGCLGSGLPPGNREQRNRDEIICIRRCCWSWGCDRWRQQLSDRTSMVSNMGDMSNIMLYYAI